MLIKLFQILMNYIYYLLGYDIIELNIINKFNYVYNELKNCKDKNIFYLNDSYFENIKKKYEIQDFILNENYKKLCIQIYIIGNILKKNQKLTLKKDFILLLYNNFKLSYLNNHSFYQSFINNKESLVIYNKILFNYDKNYDLICNINDINIQLYHIQNKDNTNYGISWSNIHKKFVFKYF
jgi:hypothetical protein